MDRNIKNNKKTVITQYTQKTNNFSDICNITTYFCRFTFILNFMKCLGGCYLFYFYFALRSKIFGENVHKSINKKKALLNVKYMRINLNRPHSFIPALYGNTI